MKHELHSRKGQIIEDLPSMIEAHRAKLADRYGVRAKYAEEAVYRGFADTWEKLPTIDYPAFYRYFYVASKNHLLVMSKRDAGRVQVDGMDWEEETAEEEDVESILDAIREGLPDKYRLLFDLNRKGRSQKYIAKVLGKSHGAVRTMKHRMITYCRKHLL